MSRKNICLFFPLGNSSLLQITGVPVYNTMPSTVAVSHLVPSGDVELLPPRVQTESNTALETTGKCDNSSIINDAAIFVSMLDDGEAFAESDVKEIKQ